VTARISSPSLGAASYQERGTWTTAVSHRWQYSDRHFVGDEEQTVREAEGSQVINNVHVVDLSVSYAVSKRINATLSVPFQFATRSQAVRDNRIPNQFGNGTVIDRYQTSASGLSDIKVLGSVWLLDPENNKKQNVSLGLGVLFPTGQKDHKDVFKVFATNSAGVYTPRAETRNVDNSIQPGAGAWGIIFDLYGFMEVFENVNVFAAGTYIATPQEDAGVNDGPGTTGQIWSVGDSYLFRAGFGYTFLPKQGLTFTLGGRMEGSPSTDIIGDSGGRRRPGFAISIEPGLVFAKNGWSASFSTPVAIYRNRERNFAGNSGDAAFADFITLFSLGRSF
jgi:hypothetical protein